MLELDIIRFVNAVMQIKRDVGKRNVRLFKLFERKIEQRPVVGFEKDFAAGNVSKGKIENTCEKYIEAGAPIIENYKEYCDCMTALPGTYSLKNEQLNLF